MEAAIILTYRCLNKCYMCNTWKYPSKIEEEFSPFLLEKLPRLDFVNITGGEPTLRDDLDEIIRILRKKAKRIVISTNGYLTQKIVDLAVKNKDLGIRISIEGLSAANDELRGIKDGFDHGLRTLLELKRIGIKDIGFGITVSDRNARDMLELYQLAKALQVEFATAVVHNSYYFHKWDNAINDKDSVIACFQELICELLKTNKIKNWYRAYFNHGLIEYIRGRKRLLACGAGRDMFFLDPHGEIRPCNGADSESIDNSFGNLKDNDFEQLWFGEKARKIRQKLVNCPKQCWMIGTASPAMKRCVLTPTIWVLKNKLSLTLGKRTCIT